MNTGRAARVAWFLVGLQPTVNASRAPHLLPEQRIVDVRRPSTWFLLKAKRRERRAEPSKARVARDKFTITRCLCTLCALFHLTRSLRTLRARLLNKLNKLNKLFSHSLAGPRARRVKGSGQSNAGLTTCAAASQLNCQPPRQTCRIKSVRRLPDNLLARALNALSKKCALEEIRDAHRPSSLGCKCNGSTCETTLSENN